jgi:hypothetical protein
MLNTSNRSETLLTAARAFNWVASWAMRGSRDVNERSFKFKLVGEGSSAHRKAFSLTLSGYGQARNEHLRLRRARRPDPMDVHVNPDLAPLVLPEKGS